MQSHISEKFKNLLSKSLKLDPEEIYNYIIKQIASEGFFDSLDGGSFALLHEKLFELAQLESGVGIGVGIMAQINVAGAVLKIARDAGSKIAGNILEKIISGEKIVSCGVSEPGWKGRLSNIKTEFFSIENKIYINGEKSFFTNGYHSDYFLIVGKYLGNYRVAIVPGERIGLSIEKFNLKFAVEATHCRIKLNNVLIEENDILGFSYMDHSEKFRLAEVISLSALFSGFGIKTLFEIKNSPEFQTLIKKDENFRKKFLNNLTLLKMLKSRIIEINRFRDEDINFQLFDEYPFGMEIAVKSFIEFLDDLKIQISYEPHQGFGLFTYRYELAELYDRKAFKKILNLD